MAVRFCRRIGLAAALMTALSVSAARAQRRPPPPVVDAAAAADQQGKPPPPTDATRFAQDAAIDEAALRLFHDAYRAEQRPKLLFVAVMQPGAPGAPFGAAGISDVLSVDIQAALSEGDTKIRFVDLTEARKSASWLDDALRRNLKAPATTARTKDDLCTVTDLLVSLDFLPLPPEARANQGVTYRCTCELHYLKSATSLPLLAFDWDGPADSRTARRYAAAITNEFCKRYARRWAQGRGSTDLVITLQLPPRGQRLADYVKSEIRRIPGIDKANLRMEFTADDPDESRATYATSIQGITSDDVQQALVESAAADHVLNIWVVRQDADSLVLSADEIFDESNAPEWYLITDQRPNLLKERFKTTYQHRRFSVAVEAGKPAGAVAQRTLDEINDEIVGDAVGLGVCVVSPTQRGPAATGADYVVDADIAPGAPLRVRLSKSNARQNVAETADWPMGDDRVKAMPPAFQGLAREQYRDRYIAGKMLLGLQRVIGGDQTMTVQLFKPRDLGQLQSVADQMVQINGVSVDGLHFDREVGVMSVHYSMDAGMLLGNIKSKLAGLLRPAGKIELQQADGSTLKLNGDPDPSGPY